MKGLKMKTYFESILAVGLFFVWFGLVGPYCISGDTLMLIVYMIATIVLIPLHVKFIKHIIVNAKKR